MSKPEPHAWGMYRNYPWAVCLHCGHVSLKNDISRWASKKGCAYREDPAYVNWLRGGPTPGAR